MLIGDEAAACTYPYINVRDPSARVEHEASTSKIGEEQLFYMQQRGLEMEEAVGMIISGFCRESLVYLPPSIGSRLIGSRAGICPVGSLRSLSIKGARLARCSTSCPWSLPRK
eukprot:7892972-Pyramimonas_sp.AAC.1